MTPEQRASAILKGKRKVFGNDVYKRLHSAIVRAINEANAEVIADVETRIRDAHKFFDECGVARGDGLGEWTIARRARELATRGELAEEV